MICMIAMTIKLITNKRDIPEFNFSNGLLSLGLSVYVKIYFNNNPICNTSMNVDALENRLYSLATFPSLMFLKCDIFILNNQLSNTIIKMIGIVAPPKRLRKINDENIT